MELRTVKHLRCTCLLLLVLLASSSAHARNNKAAPPPSPQAPVPSQILTAKTVFLSNACEIDLDHCTFLYNDFYASILSLNRYQLVLEPKSADLIFEFHDKPEVSSTSDPSGYVRYSVYFQNKLLIRDPTTQAVLWTFTYGDAGGGPSPAGILIDQVRQFLSSKVSPQTSHSPDAGGHPQPPTKTRLTSEN